MKYLLFNILADSTPTTRFARELALAIDDAGEPIRVLQLGQARLGGEIFTISRHLLEPKYHRLLKLMWGPIVPGREMYVFGDVKDVVQRILQRGECAPTNYAFVTLAGWDDTSQRLALAQGLKNYNRVYVFSEADFDALRKLDVKSEIVNSVQDYINIPQDDVEEETGKLLVVVPVSDDISEGGRHIIKKHIEDDLSEDDSVFEVVLDSREWNMSTARNLGIKEAKDRGYDYVAFNDVDVFAPVGHWREVKRLLASSKDNVVVPRYVGQPSGTVGTASGNVALHVEKALEIGGYDENYVGGGSEDVDFLFRLKKETVSFEVIPDTPPLVHIDHAPRQGRKESDIKNEQRVKRVMGYEDLPVKSCLLESDHV